MKKISISPSAATPISFDKWTKVFFGFVIIGLWSLFIFFFGKKEDKFFLYAMPIFFVAIAYALQRMSATIARDDLVSMDEVYDEGSSLLFKKNEKSVRINLTDIKDISYSFRTIGRGTGCSTPSVIASLHCRTEFGDELKFFVDYDWITGKNKDILDLIDRVERAKGQH